MYIWPGRVNPGDLTEAMTEHGRRNILGSTQEMSSDWLTCKLISFAHDFFSITVVSTGPSLRSTLRSNDASRLFKRRQNAGDADLVCPSQKFRFSAQAAWRTRARVHRLYWLGGQAWSPNAATRRQWEARRR